MNKLEWHAKLLEWAESDPRLKRLPYVHIDALEEHLAEYDAAQQSVQADETTGHPIADAVQELIRLIESDEA